MRNLITTTITDMFTKKEHDSHKATPIIAHTTAVCNNRRRAQGNKVFIIYKNTYVDIYFY